METAEGWKDIPLVTPKAPTCQRGNEENGPHDIIQPFDWSALKPETQEAFMRVVAGMLLTSEQESSFDLTAKLMRPSINCDEEGYHDTRQMRGSTPSAKQFLSANGMVDVQGSYSHMMRITREGVRIWFLALELQQKRVSKKMIEEQRANFRQAFSGAVNTIMRMNKIVSKARAKGALGDVRTSLLQRATDTFVGELDSQHPWTVQEICDEYGGKFLAFFNEELSLSTSEPPHVEEKPKTFNGNTPAGIAARNWRKKKQDTKGHVWRGGPKDRRAKTKKGA